jgi:hypothetical protein
MGEVKILKDDLSQKGREVLLEQLWDSWNFMMIQNRSMTLLG